MNPDPLPKSLVLSLLKTASQFVQTAQAHTNATYFGGRRD